MPNSSLTTRLSSRLSQAQSQSDSSGSGLDRSRGPRDRTCRVSIRNPLLMPWSTRRCHLTRRSIWQLQKTVNGQSWTLTTSSATCRESRCARASDSLWPDQSRSQSPKCSKFRWAKHLQRNAPANKWGKLLAYSNLKLFRRCVTSTKSYANQVWLHQAANGKTALGVFSYRPSQRRRTSNQRSIQDRLTMSFSRSPPTLRASPSWNCRSSQNEVWNSRLIMHFTSTPRKRRL